MQSMGLHPPLRSNLNPGPLYLTKGRTKDMALGVAIMLAMLPFLLAIRKDKTWES